MNKKIGENILHYLLLCIDRDHTIKLMRECWPIFDKKQEAQFYKNVFEWYKILSKVKLIEYFLISYLCKKCLLIFHL